LVVGDHAPAADELIVRLPPLHIDAVGGVIVVHVPVAGLAALNVYTPATAGATVGLSDVEVNPEGPAQDQLLPEVVPVNVTLPPGHTGLVLVAVAITGHNDQRYTWFAAGAVVIVVV